MPKIQGIGTHSVFDGAYTDESDYSKGVRPLEGRRGGRRQSAEGLQGKNLKTLKFASRKRLKGKALLDTTELIAAAHARSFSFALSDELGLKARATGETITTATVTAEHLAAGWTIRNIHLNVVAKLPKMTQARFIDAAVRAKINCVISRLLRANISMNAKLETNAESRQRRSIAPKLSGLARAERPV